MTAFIHRDINRYLYFFIVIISGLFSSCSGDGVYTDKSSWAVVGRMNIPRMAAASAVVEDDIYVIGGSHEKGYIADSEWVKVSPNGMLINWKKAPSLTVPRGYAAVAAYKGYVYAIGGANGEHGNNLLNTIERAPINPDGSLGRWIMEKNKMFSRRRAGTAFTAHGFLYVIGGYNGEFLDTVERALINKDGSLGKWELMTAILQERRYIHASAYTGRYIYVMGGHDRATGGALNKVEFAEVKDNGDLSEWVEAKPVNAARYGTSAVSVNGFLWLIGGYDGRALDAVERAGVNSDGTIMPWDIVSHLAIPRNSPSAVVYKNNLYVIGGSDDKGRYLNSIEAVQISDNGEIRAWKR